MNIFTLTILVFLFREVTVCHFYCYFYWLHAFLMLLINIWSVTPLRSKAWREDARACLGNFSSGDGRSGSKGGSVGWCKKITEKTMAFHAVMWENHGFLRFLFFLCNFSNWDCYLCKDKHKMTGTKSITGESFWDFIWISWGALRFP